MSDRTPQLTDVAEAILRYLDEHPHAADTAKGIAEWWLPEEWAVDVETVEKVLTVLLREGRVQQRENADRHVLICSRNSRR